jgi:hypothetical protein
MMSDSDDTPLLRRTHFAPAVMVPDMLTPPPLSPRPTKGDTRGTAPGQDPDEDDGQRSRY